MKRTNVKKYKDKQLIDRMKSLPSFRYVPKLFHLIFVRSKVNETNVFDDKLYLFLFHKCLMVLPCTTETGRWGLFNFWRYNKKGVAIIKSDEIYYDAFQKSDGDKIRHHKGKIQCLRQIKNLKYYRDGNMNDKAEEIGVVYEGNYATNIHPNSSKRKRGLWTWLVGKSSLGCLVINHLTKYYKMLDKIPYNQKITVTILKEF